MPLHYTAAGKLLLAEHLVTQGDIPPAKPARFTTYTIHERTALKRDIAAVAARGWADAPEQVVLGINAVSAPICDHKGDVVAMLSAMDSIQFIPPQPPKKLVDALREAADAVSSKLAV